jgi:hypothetical protein
MNFYGHYPAGRTPPHVNPIRGDEKVEARRQYAEERRKEAFKQQSTAQDWQSWEQGREQGQQQGRLAV